MLSDEIFKKICETWSTPDVDLFPTRLNHKVTKFASWKPNPGSKFINAFSQSWKTFAYIYYFPPFKSQKTISNNIKNWKGSHRALVIIPLGST